MAETDLDVLLVYINRITGKNYRTLDEISERELLQVLAATLIVACDAQVFLCNPREGA